MSGRTKPKKKGIFSKFPSFRKKKSSSSSPDKDANANPQAIPPPPDFATDNDTFTEPTLNINTNQTRVDNTNFNAPPMASVVIALNTNSTQSAKRPNATDEYQAGSSAKRINNKTEDTNCTIIANTSVHSPSKTASTNQALKSAFFSNTTDARQNGEIKSPGNTDLPKMIQTTQEISVARVSLGGNSGRKDDNDNPWQHMSNVKNSGKNKNEIWLSKGISSTSWVKSPSTTGTQHSKDRSNEAPSQTESSSQNTTFTLDQPVLDTTNKNKISVTKDLYNSSNTYLLDREKHDNKIRLTYTGNTSLNGSGDSTLPTCEALRKTDLNNEEIELGKSSTGSSAQQMHTSLNTKTESHRTISTSSQDTQAEQSPRVNNIQGRHESRSQSDSSPKNVSRLSAANSVPTQSTPTKQMPLSTVRHPQLSAVKGHYYSASVESAELDSLASDDLMCDSRFMDEEMVGFDEESFLSDLADGPKNSILQTRLSRNGRIRSQSFEVSSKLDDKVIDSRRIRSITMGASPPSKVCDSTSGGTIPEESKGATNSSERSKENHVGFSRLNRSLHLNLQSQLSFTSDEEVTMDANTFRHLMQDMTNMKTMLFKLKRVIQDNNQNVMTGSLPTSPITAHNPLLGQDNVLVDLTQENVQLKTEINSMKKLIEETDKTVARLHDELLEFQTSQANSNQQQVPKCDVGVQADLPIISYKVYKPSYIPQPRTFRTRSEVSRIKAAFEEYMRINGRKIPDNYPSANPEQIRPLSPTKPENQQQQTKLESPQSPRKTNPLPKLDSPKSPKRTSPQEQPTSPDNKLPKPVKVSPTETSAKPSLLQPPAGKSRQIQPPRQLHPPGKQTTEQPKEQIPRPSSNKSPSDGTTTLESPVAAETNKPKSKIPQSRLPKSNTLSKLGAHPGTRNGNQTKSDEDINTTTKSGSCNQLQSLASSNSKSKLIPPSKFTQNKEDNDNKAEKRYSDESLEQTFSAKALDCGKSEEPMVKQKSKSKLMAPGFIKKMAKSSSSENVTSQNGNHENIQNGIPSDKPLSNGNKSDENPTENDVKKQTKTGIKKPNSPKNERPLSGGLEGVSRIPGPKSRIARSTGIPSRKTTNQP